MAAGHDFEDQVRHVARALWGLPPGEGGAEYVGGQEVDCVCRTEDVVHLVMCTMLRTLEKVTRDVNKLAAAKRAEEKKNNTVKLWIVTADEPTPEQRAASQSEGARILSVAQFRARLLDAAGYLAARRGYRFGSAADPDSGSISLPEDEYVSLPLTDVSNGRSYMISTVCDDLLAGRTIVLLGPFGAGKSLTVREVFRELARRFSVDSSSPVPVAINLREHWGQQDTDEVLRRHASRIGFDRRDQLVRAWNGGRVLALLDGFDELAAQSWRVGPAAMRRTRREALGLVRAFVREARGKRGLLISGRDQYFDTAREIHEGLGIAADAVRLMLGEFTEEQVKEYLKKKHITTPVPAWLPRKPLLMGYLGARGLLAEVLSIDGGRGAAFAWDQFLDRICAREAQLTDDVDGEAVRRILETLALKTRETSSGTGPLYEKDLSEAYTKVTGVEPLEAARVLLQRLPGLTARDQEEGARSFVDADMLESLKGSAVAHYIQNPYKAVNEGPWHHPLAELGCEVAALVSERLGVSESTYRVAARESVSRWNEPTLGLDCLITGALRAQEDGLDCEGTVVRSAYADAIDLDTLCFRDLTLQGCWITKLDVADGAPCGITLEDCLISRVVGVAEKAGLPTWIANCEVDEFDSAQTTAAILRLGASLPVRVLLTLLRKIFVQKGRGRKESALYRGLDQGAQKYVPPVLDALRGEDFVFVASESGEHVWHPYRSKQQRALAILAAAGGGQDELLEKVRKIR